MKNEQSVNREQSAGVPNEYLTAVQISRIIKMKSIRTLFLANKIKKLSDLFYYMPKTNISKEIGCNYQTFTRKAKHPEHFTVNEILKIGEAYSLTPIELYILILNQLPPEMLAFANSLETVNDKTVEKNVKEITPDKNQEVNKSSRYDRVLKAYNEGELKCMRDIFTYVPINLIAKDLGRQYARLREEFVDPVNTMKKATFRDLSDLIGIDYDSLLRLAMNDKFF
ncbi:hypothetical protein [Dinghuibacter silviterrae]|uniref:Uncharacterized protein n=1 Tax=Dinghuibacter silviterrae TaxID=1539049 RepID=A0A4R8DHR9_9BACT|nr:hypothetical protein [Dinghuibacter silviterrae]TDW97077.1 hypothetical protein EDB95_4917 [Dinghuibacter silviterrae]